MKNSSDHFREEYKVLSCVLCAEWIAILELTTEKLPPSKHFSLFSLAIKKDPLYFVDLF